MYDVIAALSCIFFFFCFFINEYERNISHMNNAFFQN